MAAGKCIVQNNNDGAPMWCLLKQTLLSVGKCEHFLFFNRFFQFL